MPPISPVCHRRCCTKQRASSHETANQLAADRRLRSRWRRCESGQPAPCPRRGSRYRIPFRFSALWGNVSTSLVISLRIELSSPAASGPLTSTAFPAGSRITSESVAGNFTEIRAESSTVKDAALLGYSEDRLEVVDSESDVMIGRRWNPRALEQVQLEVTQPEPPSWRTKIWCRNSRRPKNFNVEER